MCVRENKQLKTENLQPESKISETKKSGGKWRKRYRWLEAKHVHAILKTLEELMTPRSKTELQLRK